MAVTSKRVGRLASKLMKKDLSRKEEKSVAASDLRQVRRRRKKR
jgi:hypothetical protein